MLIRKKGLADQRVWWLMLIPVIAYYLIFNYLPLIGIAISVKKYSPFLGFFKSPWNGLEYFRQFFASIYFVRVLRNKLVLGLYYLLFAFPAPIVLALLLNGIGNRILKKTYQTITLLPHFVSFVVIAGIAVNMLSPGTGVINAFLGYLGMEPVFFMQKQEYFRGIYTFIRVFKESGFEAIVYLAALTAIDPTLYEAADVDGAVGIRPDHGACLGFPAGRNDPDRTRKRNPDRPPVLVRAGKGFHRYPDFGDEVFRIAFENNAGTFQIDLA